MPYLVKQPKRHVFLLQGPYNCLLLIDVLQHFYEIHTYGHARCSHVYVVSSLHTDNSEMFVRVSYATFLAK